MSQPPADRIRTLLLRADNVLKIGHSPERARAALEEALELASDPRLRELVERRLAALERAPDPAPAQRDAAKRGY